MVIKNISKIDEVQESEKDKIALVHFYADWSDECKNINSILEALSDQPEYSSITFKKCAAEDFPDISLKFDVTAVPTILFFQKGEKIDELTGADPAALNGKLQKFVKLDKQSSDPPSVISSELIVACVEGDGPAAEELHSILNNAKIKYKTYDVNTDEIVKQKLKASSGSSFPQLYIQGEFFGDLETVKKYGNSGELSVIAEGAEKKLGIALVSRLLSLIKKSKRMVFMKGEKEAPRCKFSRELTEILKETGLPYDTFDILTDEDVRQGLKVLMNWPTYPQVYVDGEFIGGVDIIKSLKEDGELLSALKP